MDYHRYHSEMSMIIRELNKHMKFQDRLLEMNIHDLDVSEISNIVSMLNNMTDKLKETSGRLESISSSSKWWQIIRKHDIKLTTTALLELVDNYKKVFILIVNRSNLLGAKHG